MTPPCILLGLLLVASTATAHIIMSDPPPIRYDNNPYTALGDEDWGYFSPLESEGEDFPCKGHHKDMGTPGGHSVADYVAGGTYNISLEGISNHGGGSCQIALSHDKGDSFSVIKSYIGDCPKTDNSSEQVFSFTVPDDTPAGDALLSWSWFNKIGNREMYMNCAVVTISSGHSKKRYSRGSIYPRIILPNLFVANIRPGCSTVEFYDVVFPSPGRDVTYGLNGTPGAPEGDCGPIDIWSNEAITEDTTSNDGNGTSNSDIISSPAALRTVDVPRDDNGASRGALSANPPSTWCLLGVMILCACAQKL